MTLCFVLSVHPPVSSFWAVPNRHLHGFITAHVSVPVVGASAFPGESFFSPEAKAWAGQSASTQVEKREMAMATWISRTARRRGMRDVGRAMQTLSSPEKLEDVVKMGLLARHDARGVARIWAAQHAKEEERGRVGTHIDAKSYGKFVERAKEAPLFVLPLAKPEGYLTVVLQVQLPRVLFTTLEEYRTHTTSSKAHLAITHYTELAADKGIVLVRGDVLQKSDVNIFEAKALLKHTYDFYLDPRKYEVFVRKFNHNPASFQFKDLLVELGFWK